ncbi:hypothetical protein ACLB2K_045433 [Fragaria x ananassa]
MVIEDASNDDIVSLSTNQSILRHLPHNPGDELTVLAVLHQIKFNMEVLAGLSPNMIAANAVKRLGATWVILDRKMKKDKQFFMENLTCGHFEEDEVTTNTGRAKTEVLPSIASSSSKQHIYKNDWIEEFQEDEVFKNSTCTLCNNQRPKIGWKRDFTYAEFQAATDGFSTKNFLSDNEFGSIHKGELNGVRIVVKQHKNASFQGEREFKSEVHVLSKASHENLVMLIGSCSEGGQRLLVYEYVCYGSLDQHLSSKQNTN